MRLIVADALGRPQPAATVQVGSGAPQPVDAAGTLSLPGAASAMTITAGAPTLHDVSVTFVPLAGGLWEWDDPGTSTVPGPDVTFVVRLPAVRAAPLVSRGEDELRRTARPAPSPGVLVTPAGRYRGLFDGELRFHIAGERLLGRAAGNGWERLDDRSVDHVNPSTAGQAAFLEWGGLAGAPRLLVGMWAPWPRGTAAFETSQDALVYYTPNTRAHMGYPVDKPPYSGAYPYGLTWNGQSWGQPYVGLALRYLFNEKFVTYQMLAARRHALVVCPVQPAAQWQTFATRPGLHRLLTEVALWWHRHSAAHPMPAGPAPAPDPTFQRRRFQTWREPPRLGVVATAGFSAGMTAVSTLISNPRQPRQFTGPAFSGDGATFDRSWREIWDLDAPSTVCRSPKEWDALLYQWVHQRDQRVAHVYHTEHTGWSTSDVSPRRKLVAGVTPRAASHPQRSAVTATHPRNGSVTVFTSTYLYGGTAGPGWQQGASSGRAPDRPSFWTSQGAVGPVAHQNVPVTCLGNAALRSSLRRSGAP